MQALTKPLSKREARKVLRIGKAIELVPGGVWYYKDRDGSFKRVVSDLDYLDDNYRTFCNNCSKMNLMYLLRDKPNYSMEVENHIFDEELIKKYKK